jgi:mono/diheme cytochrome c family protein
MAGRRNTRVRGVVVSAALLTAWTAPAGAVPPDGKALYNAKCAQCHGRDGTARPLYAKKGTPDLNDPDWQKERSDEEIRKSIADGSEGTLMKAYKEYWDAAQIEAVVKYVRTLKPAAPAK